jgi:uncharacterized caspase-like protein
MRDLIGTRPGETAPVGRPARMLRSIVTALALIALSLVSNSARAETESRVALVIGNGAYQHVPRLDNPVNDARLIAATLKELGFTLIGGKEQTDLDRAAFERAIREFGGKLAGGSVGLVYYAGHGVQVQGNNYLVPVGANLTSAADIDYELIDANLLLRQMKAAGSKLNFVILDACRNNPLSGRGLRDATGGLAPMHAPTGTLISYATQPGNVARDGSNGHSPYTKALAEALLRPGMPALEVFNAVGLAVDKATGGEQQPWVEHSPLEGNFFFLGPTNVTITPAPAAPAPVDAEVVFWQSIAASSNAADFEDYLRKFPNGMFASLAQRKLNDLRKPASQSVVDQGGDRTPCTKTNGHTYCWKWQDRATGSGGWMRTD